VSAVGVGITAEAEHELELDAPIDLAATMWPLAHGPRDPTIRLTAAEVWRASRLPSGPATLRVRATARAIHGAAWGPGAEEAITRLPDLVGATDHPELLVPRHRTIADLVHRMPGLRLTHSGRVFEALLPAICEQKVTGAEAWSAFRALVLAYGEPAPGPVRLRLPPEPSALAKLPYFGYHRFGLERRRADLIRRAAQLAPRLEAAEPGRAYALMGAVPGIGPWTKAEVGRVAFGDPDAVSVGDYHLPSMVAWALAGETKADDARMLELLEPYRGQRGRVQRLLEASGIHLPRRGPRMAPRHIEAI
jgi:3-methyladenine DNA glycosylase/8-oxoguanine DNA glycosylase